MTTDDPLLQQALELAAQATPENFEEIIKKAQELPLVYELVVTMEATRRDMKLTNVEAFTTWLDTHAYLLYGNPIIEEAYQKLGWGEKSKANPAYTYTAERGWYCRKCNNQEPDCSCT